MKFEMWAIRLGRKLWFAVLAISAVSVQAQEAHPGSVAPSTMPKLNTVDDRFLSYNVEMVEVTGGRFWKPYKSSVEAHEAASPNTPPDPNQQVGVDASLYQYRPPIDLTNRRLLKLAAALGPAYVRVSGTWQNSTYFQNDDKPGLTEPPKGFKGVLTRAEWKRVIEFARATDAKLVTSVAISLGTRDGEGVWTPNQAKAILDYTKSLGGSLAATEFMNEPSSARSRSQRL